MNYKTKLQAIKIMRLFGLYGLYGHYKSHMVNKYLAKKKRSIYQYQRTWRDRNPRSHDEKHMLIHNLDV